MHFLKYFAFIIFVASLNCGGSSSGGSTGGSTTNATTAESTVESSIKGSLTSANTTGGQIANTTNSVNAPALVNGEPQYILSNCLTSGTVDIEIDSVNNTITLTYDMCVIDSLTTNGSFSAQWTESGNDYTGTITYSDYSIQDSDSTVQTDGTISDSYSDANSLHTYTFNLTGTDNNNDTLTTTGEVTVTTANLANGTLNISYQSTTYSCVFDDFNLSTATDSDWASACSVSS